MKVIFLLPALCVSIAAQTPCSDADLRRAMAESRAEAAEVKVEAGGARIEALERELARQKGQALETEQRLNTEQKNTATLASQNEGARLKVGSLQSNVEDLQKSLTTKDLQIVMLSQERDRLERQIKKANGTFMCEIFRLGCIR